MRHKKEVYEDVGPAEGYSPASYERLEDALRRAGRIVSRLDELSGRLEGRPVEDGPAKDSINSTFLDVLRHAPGKLEELTDAALARINELEEALFS